MSTGDGARFYPGVGLPNSGIPKNLEPTGPSADATAMNAEQVVRAAIEWKQGQGFDPSMGITDWRLWDAVDRYGPSYRGLKSS